MIRKKVSMLGSFAVGKSSLVRRFVSGIFSERYVTTVGVRIDKKVVDLDGVEMSMVLWDIHGEDEFQKVRKAYLRGSSGCLFVADGTRADTLEVVRRLHDLATATLGERVPFTLLVNKSDLRANWEIADAELAALEDVGWRVVRTSAKTGEHVESVFVDLARRMLTAD